MLFKISMGTRKNFFEICRQFGHAPLKKFRQPWPRHLQLLSCSTTLKHLQAACTAVRGASDHSHSISSRTAAAHHRDFLLLEQYSTGSSKKMDGISNRYNLKRTGRIYTIRVLKCSEKFKVLD